MLPLWLVELYVFDRSVPMNLTAVWSIGFMTLGPSVLQIFWAYSVSGGRAPPVFHMWHRCSV